MPTSDGVTRVVVQPGRALLEQRDGDVGLRPVHAAPTVDRGVRASTSQVPRSRSPTPSRRGAVPRASTRNPAPARRTSIDRCDRSPRRRGSPSRRTAGRARRRSVRASARGRRGSPDPWAASIIWNSSALDDPNTPPCSTRTTYRAPSAVSTYQFARELPVAIRCSWATMLTSPRTCSASHRWSGSRNCLIHRVGPGTRSRAAPSPPARRRAGGPARDAARRRRRRAAASSRPTAAASTAPAAAITTRCDRSPFHASSTSSLPASASSTSASSATRAAV